MSFTDLGSGMKSRPMRDDLVFRSDVEGIIASGMRELERKLQQFVNGRIPQEQKPPVVNVHPSASAPDVKVEVSAPAVTVDAPVDVTVPGLESFATELSGLRGDIQALASLLRQPVTRTVERDQAGWIISVTETR